MAVCLDWCHNGPFCAFNAHVSFMSCPQHLYYKYMSYNYLYYKSHSRSCKVTKYELWSKTVYFRLHLPSCSRWLLLSLFVCGDDAFLFLSHFTQKNGCLECMGSNFISHQNNQGMWLIWWHELCFGKMLKLWFDHLNNICKKYKFWDISLFNFLKPPLFTFLLHPNTFLSTPFLNTFWFVFHLMWNTEFHIHVRQ